MPNIIEPPKVEVGDERPVREGQWYWVKETARWKGDADDDGNPLKKGKSWEWLGCIWAVGSNYVEVRSPTSDDGYRSSRIHFDDFHATLRHEPEAARIIAGKAAGQQMKLRGLLNDIRELAARLGFQPVTMLDAPSADPGTALAVISSTKDPKAYGADLVKAKTETLPALQEAIKKETKELNRWLLAGTMQMKIEQRQLTASLGSIDERIFNISLYAGLTEEVEKIADGAAAPATEKIHVLQRRLYMDEECLLSYKAGGMVFKNIGAFDEWLSRPDNRDRILPWPRCVVSMRVRRHRLDRESHNLSQAFINIRLGELDKLTFLYIRNGDQLWRLSCDQDFGEKLFPALYESGRPVMMKTSFRKVEKFMDRAEYEHLCALHQGAKARYEAWKKGDGRGKSWIEYHDPITHYSALCNDINVPGEHSFRPQEWEPFDPSSVYFDDATKKVAEEIKAYNRIVLVLQGLIDRSEVLHPHPPINLWNADHMQRYIELVSDAANVLADGDKPDFEAYRDKLNASITTESVLVGQQDFWQEKMAAQENERDRLRRRDRYTPLRRYKPNGNDGPQEPCKPVKVSARNRTATFAWTRKGRYDSWKRDYPDVNSTVTVPFSRLFNVSAYRAGDYLQFFRDHRTRQDYLQWAPYLLAAEDHVGGA